MLLKLSLFLLLVACVPCSSAYREQYAYLREVPKGPLFTDSPYYVVFLVNARHLDYSSGSAFLRTVTKHPSDGSKNGDVGHAWIYLKGAEIMEGGHSGELGVWQPRYVEGVIDNVYLGAIDPVKYLFCSQCDGFFQKGNGGHRPTFAAKVEITAQQYCLIKNFIASYPFQDYAIIGRQCSSFVTEIAALLGISLEDKVTLPIEQWIYMDGQLWQLWQDPRYQALTFSSPDRLEKSLMQLVRMGKAENALSWYRKMH